MQKQGFEVRLAKDAEDLLFGKGIYLGESSTKSDQYAGERFLVELFCEKPIYSKPIISIICSHVD